MQLKELKPRKALNKAFLKIKPNRTEIEHFKANLIQLLDRTNDTESEEFHKNLVSDFLKKTYYDPNYFINTKGRNDLVIHNGNNAAASVGVSPAAGEARIITSKESLTPLMRRAITPEACQVSRGRFPPRLFPQAFAAGRSDPRGNRAQSRER